MEGLGVRNLKDGNAPQFNKKTTYLVVRTKETLENVKEYTLYV